MGCHSLLQGIFLTQGSPRWILYQEDPRGKEKLHELTLHLDGEWVESQRGHPSLGVLCVEDKHLWLLGELLGQVERLKLSPHSWGVHGRCATGQRGEPSALEAAASLCS